MRAFIFAIGGTGSRVLNAMIMQLAAGVRPKTQDGKVIDSIVPIIIDPHADCGSLQELTRLLDNYRSIRRSIYAEEGTEKTKDTDFFSVKIETLKDVEENSTNSDKFYFSMKKVSDNMFKDYIEVSAMTDQCNSDLAKLLFSGYEMDTNMKEGFYGSPNIGCVALSEFTESADFKAFCEAYTPGDKIFFIGSIFGGTGASGLPLFISSIRDLANKKNTDMVKGDCAKAPIGALVVMPYFSLTHKDGSPINENDWVIKSRSAISYYKRNLNEYINDIYYIADPQGTSSFENDPGNLNNQKGNKAHIVEYIGAHAFFNFLHSGNVECAESDGQIKAAQTRFYQYGLATDQSAVTFKGLSADVLELAEKPMMRFHLLRCFMRDSLSDMWKKPFAEKYAPKLDSSILTREIEEFFQMYDKWLVEMASHGSTAHNLDLFAAEAPGVYSTIFKDIEVKRSWGGLRTLSVDDGDVLQALNKAAESFGNGNEKEMHKRWYRMAGEALDKVIEDNYQLIK